MLVEQLEKIDKADRHSFNVSDGTNPSLRLVQGANGYLYGVTYAGGANNLGTVFSLSPPH